MATPTKNDSSIRKTNKDMTYEQATSANINNSKGYDERDGGELWVKVEVNQWSKNSFIRRLINYNTLLDTLKEHFFS